MVKKNKKLIIGTSPMEIFIKTNKERPFTTEYGHLKKRVPQKGGVQMMYCEHCDSPAQGDSVVANICGLCGNETQMHMLTVKELQGRSMEMQNKGYILIGHEDVRWWE